MGRQEESDRARRVGRGHRGALEERELASEDARQDVDTGRGHIGLEPEIVRRRPAAGERREDVRVRGDEVEERRPVGRDGSRSVSLERHAVRAGHDHRRNRRGVHAVLGHRERVRWLVVEDDHAGRAAVTAIVPASTAALIASESVSCGPWTRPPMLRLITSMPSATAFSTAAMMSWLNAPPPWWMNAEPYPGNTL